MVCKIKSLSSLNCFYFLNRILSPVARPILDGLLVLNLTGPPAVLLLGDPSNLGLVFRVVKMCFSMESFGFSAHFHGVTRSLWHPWGCHGMYKVMGMWEWGGLWWRGLVTCLVTITMPDPGAALVTYGKVILVKNCLLSALGWSLEAPKWFCFCFADRGWLKNLSCSMWWTVNVSICLMNYLNLSLAPSHVIIIICKHTIQNRFEGLMPVQRLAITWSNDDFLSIVPLGTKFGKISIKKNLLDKVHINMLSAKWRPFCEVLNVLNS